MPSTTQPPWLAVAVASAAASASASASTCDAGAAGTAVSVAGSGSGLAAADKDDVEVFAIAEPADDSWAVTRAANSSCERWVQLGCQWMESSSMCGMLSSLDNLWARVVLPAPDLPTMMMRKGG